MTAQMMATCSSTGMRLILRLLQHFGQALAAVELSLGRRVEVGAELREGGQFAELGQVELHATGDLLHRLDLGIATDAADRETDVDRRANTGVEEVGFQEDLAVGDRDDVGRNIGRNVVGLRLDDRQGRQTAAAQFVAHARARSSRRECR